MQTPTKLRPPKWYWLLILTLLCSIQPSLSYAQLSVFPSEPGKFAGYVSAPEAGKWLVIATGWLPVEATVAPDGKSVVFQAPAGIYGVLYFPPGDAQPVVKPITLGGINPGPGPTPVPVPPPLPPGQKWLLLVRESGQPTPQQSQLLLSLRKNPELNRKVVVTDPDVPAGLVQTLVSKLPSTTVLPIIAIVSSVDNVILSVVPLPATVDQIKELLK